jgi:hypothetical protein
MPPLPQLLMMEQRASHREGVFWPVSWPLATGQRTWSELSFGFLASSQLAN